MSELSNNKPCPHCGQRKQRAITIDALISKENKILLIKRNNEPFKGSWAIPGGYIDWDETAEEALKREVKEETGLDVTEITFFDVYSDPKRDPRQNITLVYQIETDGEPKAGDDAKELKWFDFHNLPELAFDHEKIIENYIK